MRRTALMRHPGFLAILPLAVVLVILGAAARQGWSAKKGSIPFEDARIYIEFNSTSQDVGIQVHLDAEAWRNLRIVDPRGRKLLELNAQGSIRQLGLSEFFFESDEPGLDDLSLGDFFALFPEGEYKFFATSPDGEKLFSTATFSHEIPDGPEVTSSDTLDPDNAVIRWNAVTTPPGIEIATYEVVIETEETTFDVTLPGSATRVTVPPEFLEPNTEYLFEVLAKADNGNQTITESTFTTTN
jgi:Fibronectin type III domain